MKFELSVKNCVGYLDSQLRGSILINVLYHWLLGCFEATNHWLPGSNQSLVAPKQPITGGFDQFFNPSKKWFDRCHIYKKGTPNPILASKMVRIGFRGSKMEVFRFYKKLKKSIFGNRSKKMRKKMLMIFRGVWGF